MNPAKRFSQDSKAVDNERAALIEEIERAKEVSIIWERVWQEWARR